MLFSVNCAQARARSAKPKQAARPQQPAQIKRAQPTPTKQQQPLSQKMSYASALATIKTKMTAAQVIRNDALTPEFINFVLSCNFSPLETTALLEAGVNIYTNWTNDAQTNKELLLSLRNNIQTVIQSQFLHAIRLQEPIKKPELIINKPIVQQQIKPAVTPFLPQQIDEPSSPAEDRSITNNLIMILDPRETETVQNGSKAGVQRALIALDQKASPIIMSSNIWKLITQARQNIGEQELRNLRALKGQQILSYSQQLLQKVGITGFSAYFIILISRIDFDPQNIHCYFHTADNLVLVIPRQYVQINMPSAANLSPTDQAKFCGFNPAVLNLVTDMTTNNLLQQIQIQKSKAAGQEKFIPHLTSMFIPQKRNGEPIHPEQTSKWFIYIFGHGHAAHLTMGFVREQLALLKPAKGGRQRIVTFTDDKGRKIPSSEILRQYEPMAEGRKSWDNAQIAPESAQIAGIPAPQFAQLMKFFDNSLDTAYVHYETCFAGGSNQTFVNESLSSLDVHFVVSTQGVHEGYTTSGLHYSYDGQNVTITGQNYIEFFKLLKIYFTQQESFIKGIKKDKRKEVPDLTALILKTLTSHATPENQPFIRFPSAGSFVAASQTEQVTRPDQPGKTFTQKTEVLTKTMVKAHEIEQKPITINNDVNVVIINIPRINIPLTIKGSPTIIIPSPQSFLPGYEAFAVFKEINWQDTVQSLLYNLCHLNAHLYPHTFVIKTLSGIQLQQSGLPMQGSSNIRNFIVQIKGIPGKGSTPPAPSVLLGTIGDRDVQLGKIGMNINVCFELGNTLYQCAFAIRNVEDKTMAQYINGLTFSAQPMQSVDMNAIMRSFLTPQEINKIAKPITLESIIDFIDSKIDRQDPSMAIWSEADTNALRKSMTGRVNK